MTGFTLGPLHISNRDPGTGGITFNIDQSHGEGLNCIMKLVISLAAIVVHIFKSPIIYSGCSRWQHGLSHFPIYPQNNPIRQSYGTGSLQKFLI